LLRKIAQGLAVRLDLFKLFLRDRIVWHDEIVGCSNALITLCAYTYSKFFDGGRWFFRFCQNCLSGNRTKLISIPGLGTPRIAGQPVRRPAFLASTLIH